MPKPVFCRLADDAAMLPMPDRGGRLFSAAGETVDLENPFWMRALSDGDIVPAAQPAAKHAARAARETPKEPPAE